jgi:hypothetical protein
MAKKKRINEVILYIYSEVVSRSYSPHIMNLDDVHPNLIPKVIEDNPTHEHFQTRHLDTFIIALHTWARYNTSIRLIEISDEHSKDTIIDPSSTFYIPKSFKSLYKLIGESYE